MSYNSNLPAWQYSNPVLSLRQYYAGQALASIAQDFLGLVAGDSELILAMQSFALADPYDTAARVAFEFADAMIKAEGKDASS
jgi:hypothetical protein